MKEICVPVYNLKITLKDGSVKTLELRRCSERYLSQEQQSEFSNAVADLFNGLSLYDALNADSFFQASVQKKKKGLFCKTNKYYLVEYSLGNANRYDLDDIVEATLYLSFEKPECSIEYLTKHLFADDFIEWCKDKGVGVADVLKTLN